MLSAIHVEELPCYSVGDLEVEIVERKGKGHPDSLIDGAAEAVSLGLCNYYLENFGEILHHNVDKGILVGGKADVRFGGGRVAEPIYLMVAGRATDTVPTNGKQVKVPVNEIAQKAVKDFIRETMRFLDPEEHLRVETKIKQGSPDLTALFSRTRDMPVSNDTSIGVGYAPLTQTEQIVIDIEKFLNSVSFKKKYPEVGEDVKVMGLRRRKKLDVTVAAAMISSLLPDAKHYVGVIEEVKDKIEELVSKSELRVEVRLNSADDYRKGSFYLTVTGTSAEHGDDGNTGRGNRINGLISPMRQYSMEATAGKNPINHTGKLFNAVALLAAGRIVEKVSGVKEAYVRLLSRIGNPINKPQIASAAVILEKGKKLSQVSGDVESILNDSMNGIRGVTDLILQRKIVLF